MKVFLPDIAPQPITIDIVSRSPGRVRLRVSPEHRQPEVMDKLASSLKTIVPEVDRLRSLPSTGSITLYYSPERVDFAGAIATLKSFGIILEEDSPRFPESPTGAPGVRGAMAKLDRQLQQATGGAASLGSIASLVLSLLVLRLLSARAPRLKSLLLWSLLGGYVVESLLLLNPSRERRPSQTP